MMKKIISKLYLLLLLIPLSEAAVADVDGVRVWQSPDYTRLVFDLSKPHEHKIFTLVDPYRVVIDLGGDAHLKPDVKDVKLDSTLIMSLYQGRQKNNDLRLVFLVREDVSVNSLILPPNTTYPHNRLVVDLKEKNAPNLEPTKAIKTVADKVAHNKRNIIIAIDAGHGGEDPGAVGYRKTKEKDVVLKIAKELARLLEKEPGYTPYLTRTGDYYIPLRERTRKARDANADLFISIHADAFRNSQANGSSVFVLSERGASSEESRYLAQKENEADLVGGVSLGDKDDYGKYIAKLSEKEVAILESGYNYYNIDFKNKGGLVMPIILNFTFEDKSTQEIRIPAEIWRRNDEEVSKVFFFEKEVVQIDMDPWLETADTDLSDNNWPRKAQLSKFKLYQKKKYGWGADGKENQMQIDRRNEVLKKKAE